MKTTISECLGWAAGWLLAPAAAAGSAIRRARALHPAGVVYKARVEPTVSAGALGDAANRLAGGALVRLSRALWRGRAELPDVLGFAARFHGPHAPTPRASPGDQDILFATVRRPAALLFGPLTTNAHSYLLNTYFGMSPFDIDGVGRVMLRLVPTANAARAAGGSPRSPRDEELRLAVEAGDATFSLEVKRRRRGASWEPMALIRLVAPSNVDQEALRFSPFQSDRGVAPRGFVHALRHAVYWASQRARPARA